LYLANSFFNNYLIICEIKVRIECHARWFISNEMYLSIDLTV